jgi:hypothetical protein
MLNAASLRISRNLCLVLKPLVQTITKPENQGRLRQEKGHPNNRYDQSPDWQDLNQETQGQRTEDKCVGVRPHAFFQITPLAIESFSPIGEAHTRSFNCKFNQASLGRVRLK